jgi:hypothetical protein
MELTLNEVKSLISPTSSVVARYVGMSVIVRSGQAGVFVGTLLEGNDHALILGNVRKLWSFEGANTVSHIAEYGITGGKVTFALTEQAVSGWCEIIPTTAEAYKIVMNIKSW